MIDGPLLAMLLVVSFILCGLVWSLLFAFIRYVLKGGKREEGMNDEEMGCLD